MKPLLWPGKTIVGLLRAWDLLCQKNIVIARFLIVSVEPKSAPSKQVPEPIAVPSSPEIPEGGPERLDLGKSVGNGDGDSRKKKARTEPQNLIPELKLVDVATDGNCLFHAIAKTLEFHGKEVPFAPQIKLCQAF